MARWDVTCDTDEMTSLEKQFEHRKHFTCFSSHLSRITHFHNKQNQWSIFNLNVAVGAGLRFCAVFNCDIWVKDVIYCQVLNRHKTY